MNFLWYVARTFLSIVLPSFFPINSSLRNHGDIIALGKNIPFSLCGYLDKSFLFSVTNKFNIIAFGISFVHSCETVSSKNYYKSLLWTIPIAMNLSKEYFQTFFLVKFFSFIFIDIHNAVYYSSITFLLSYLRVSKL